MKVSSHAFELSVNGINFTPFLVFSIAFWNCAYSVVFLFIFYTKFLHFHNYLTKLQALRCVLKRRFTNIFQHLLSISVKLELCKNDIQNNQQNIAFSV